MSVLVDTSIWVNHFKKANQNLIALLMRDEVICHPYILGEIACGTPAERARTLADLNVLSMSKRATMSEVLYLIETKKLYGRGCGLIDAALLASALINPNTKLWTADRKLNQLATELEVKYTP